MEDVLALVGDIYDAALNPDSWDQVLRKITEFIGGVSSVLLAQDFVNLEGRFFHHWNDNPDYTELFFSKYMKLSPLSPHLMMSKPGDIVVASRLMPHEELRASRFFREWVEPQQYYDFVGVTIENSGGRVANLTSGGLAQQGLITDDQVRRMTLIGPHIRRAVVIGDVIEQQFRIARDLAEVFDRLAVGIFLVRADGAITYANAPGRRLMEEADVVQSVDGSLKATSATAASQLQSAIASAGEGDAAIATKGIALPLKGRTGAAHVANVLPLASGERTETGRAFEAKAAVFIRKAGLDLPNPIELMARQYRLTAAEIRVLYSLMEMSGISAAADLTGLSEATVKTHIRHLFAKTGTKRQGDLVKLVAGLASPVGPAP
jgi:DNA-binding CsgD family transcriptional regulator/PAS domain-containing protein